jgi:hypothetical protein
MDAAERAFEERFVPKEINGLLFRQTDLKCRWRVLCGKRNCNKGF